MSMIEWKLRGVGGMTLATGMGVILPPQVQAQVQQSRFSPQLQQALWEAASGGPTTGGGSGAPPAGTPDPSAGAGGGTTTTDMSKAPAATTDWTTYAMWGGLGLAAVAAGWLALSVLRR